MTDSTDSTAVIEAPAPAPKSKGGRPKGSRTRRPGGAIAGRLTEPAPDDAALSAALFPPASAPAGEEPRTIPPASAGAPSAKGGRPKATDVRDAELKRTTEAAYRRLSSMLGLAALPASMLLGAPTGARFVAVSAALDANAADCAASMVEWSRTNKRLRAMLENVGNGSGMLAVLMAHSPILLALVRAPIPAGAPGAPGAPAGGADLLSMMDLLFSAEAPAFTDATATDG